MTTGTPANPHRRHKPPAELILVVVLTYVAGVLSIGVGILFILLRYVADIATLGGQFGVTLIGAGVILFGLFIIALASALSRGKHYARVGLTIALGVETALAVISLIVDADSVWFEVLLIVVSVLIVLALWVGRPRAYFAHVSERDAAARKTGM